MIGQNEVPLIKKSHKTPDKFKRVYIVSLFLIHKREIQEEPGKSKIAYGFPRISLLMNLL